jgi:hypothetical protein
LLDALRHLLTTPPPAFLFHSQCQTSARDDIQSGCPSGLSLFRLRPLRTVPVRDEAGDICRAVPTVNHFSSPFSAAPQDPQIRPKTVRTGQDKRPEKQRLQSAGKVCICPAVFVCKRNLRKEAAEPLSSTEALTETARRGYPAFRCLDWETSGRRTRAPRRFCERLCG